MGLLRRVLFAPVTAPAATTVWLARQLQARANEELNDPVAIRAALATLEAQLLAGEISEESYDAAEQVLLSRLGAVQ